MGKTLEELGLPDDPLPDLGWSSYLELGALIDAAWGLDLDDELLFALFCNTLRRS